MLISAYEDATRINAELGEKQMELTRLAAGLGKKVEERTAALRAEIVEHKMAPEQLYQSEEQFRVITESISDLIAVLDLEGKRLYNSPSYKDVLGDPIALRGTDSFNEIHPDDRERIRKIFHDTVRTGRGQRAEYRFLLSDGSIRYIESEGSAIPDAEGKTAKVVVVSRDVTERKRAEEALRESEEKYRSLVSNIPDVSWTLDDKRRFVFISSNIERLSGFSPDEVYQHGARLYLSSLHPEDVPKVNEAFRALFAEGRPFDVEVRARRKDGEWKWAHHRALATYEKNGIRYADGLLSDITERKRAEEALRQSEAMLREALLAAQMGVWEWTVATDTVTWDENLYTIAGRDPKLPAPSYQEHPQVYTPESWERLKAAVENALATGTPYELDLDLICPDGSKRWVIGRGHPLRDASGRITHLRGTVQDITERKQSEEALRRRAAFDELMAKILGRFASCAWSEVDSSVVSALQAVAEFIGVDHAYVIRFSADSTTWSATHEWCGSNVPPRLQYYQNIRLGTQSWSERRILANEIIRLNSPDDLPPEALAERQHYEVEGALSALDVPIKVAAGAIKGCVGFHSVGRPIAWSDTDVSHVRMLGDAIASVIERKRAEEELRESEERYRRLFEVGSDAILLVEVDTGRILDANAAALKLYGYSREEFLVLTGGEIFAEPEKIRAALADERAQVQLRWHRKKDGTVFPVELTGNSFVNDGRRIHVAAVRDITERLRAEVEHTRLVAAIEQSAEAVVITNTNGDIEYVNPAFTRISGYSREEVLGHNPRILKSGKHDPAFYQELWENILKGEIWRGEIVNRRKDGSLYTEEMNIAPVRDALGEITHFIATKQDVTEHKALEERLRQSAKMEAIGRLAGGIAHDFNNLLTIINGYSELGLDGLNSDDPMRRYLNEIMKAGERAASLTRQLLAFSRQQVLAPQVLNLNDVVTNVGEMLRRLIGEDINLVMVPDRALGRVKADAGQIEQILMNLGANARDAMPKGGKLVIETANVELDATYARSHMAVAPGHYVMLAVSDTGVGMDAETQAHIFEPFFTTKEKGKGTGLGLATVYGIVKQSGGYIWVYSEPGRGSTFKIYLPRVEEAGESVQFPEASGHPVAASETILLVEDEEAVRALAARILQRLGYKVLESTSPEDALKISERHTETIHLLLTDVVLPSMSGRKVAELLAPLRPGMKALFMSGYTDDSIVRSGVLEATAAFLQKPFTPVTLARKVREVLDSGREQNL